MNTLLIWFGLMLRTYIKVQLFTSIVFIGFSIMTVSPAMLAASLVVFAISAGIDRGLTYPHE